MKTQSKYIQQQDLLAYVEHLVELLKEGDVLRNDVKSELSRLGYSLMFYASTLSKAGALLAGEGRKLQYKTPSELELSPELVEALDKVEAFIKENKSAVLSERKRAFSQRNKNSGEYEVVDFCTWRGDVNILT